MSASASHRSPALALEELLEGRGVARKAAGGGLLTGLGARLTRASALAPRGGSRESLATGVDALDRLLSGGLPRGGFVEVVARRSSGRFSLAIAALAAATSSGESAALVDVGGHLDPQSAEEAGVELERLLWVRPEKLKHAVAAAELLLATGFALVVVDLGVPPVRGRFVPDAAWVRLERAARDRGASLLLLSPYRVGSTAEAVVSLDAAHAVWRGERRAPPMLSGIGARMTLLKDASAKEGARGEVRLWVDPVLDSVKPSASAGAQTVGGAAPAAAPSRRDIRGVSSSSPDWSSGPPLPSEEERGDGRPEARSARHPEARSAEGSPTSSPRSRVDSGIHRSAQDDAYSPIRPVVSPEEKRRDFSGNSSPRKSVLPLGDGMAPFDPPSPIPGEGGIFFGPPRPAVPSQLPLLP